jgi:hypothetical protein
MTRLATLIALTMLATACAPPPELVDAHLLERAASWASAVQFAGELRDAERVPDSYVRQVTKQAAGEVRTLASQFTTTPEAPIACGRLAGALTDAGDRPADRGRLRELELQLRDLAQDRRRAAGGGAAR